jgi:hypothetical protein
VHSPEWRDKRVPRVREEVRGVTRKAAVVVAAAAASQTTDSTHQHTQAKRTKLTALTNTLSR